MSRSFSEAVMGMGSHKKLFILAPDLRRAMTVARDLALANDKWGYVHDASYLLGWNAHELIVLVLDGWDATRNLDEWARISSSLMVLRVCGALVVDVPRHYLISSLDAHLVATIDDWEARAIPGGAA